jgi:glycosyltransferase involved in cell wall biosynthesis
MSLRIMHISTRLILGGSQENTVLSCEGQLTRGHDVALVYGPIYGPEGSLLERVQKFRATEPHPLSEGAGWDGEQSRSGDDATHRPASSLEGRGIRAIELFETPNLVREIAPAKDFRCYHDLRAVIREWRPDVVHTHSSKAGILGRDAGWRERVPCVVHTIHGLPFHPYEKWWRNAIYVASERRAAKRCHRIICVAEAMRDQSLAKRIGRPAQYDIVYSGMEIESFLRPRWKRAVVRAELGLADDDFVLGTVARLAELKGHDDLLDALGASMKENPSLKLLWVGDGWWRGRLIARVRDMGLERQVLTTGLVPSEEVSKWLCAMDALAHPSYREGLPRTVPQALLSAVPVIAYDVDGAREVCIPGETGVLVNAGDRDGLRAATQWMIDHPAERRELAERGRKLCGSRFDAAIMVERLENIYAQCLDQHSPRGDDRGE